MCAVLLQDPYPKPCYLFALVAGDLAMKEDKYTTGSGRTVTLRIFTQAANISQVTQPGHGRGWAKSACNRPYLQQLVAVYNRWQAEWWLLQATQVVNDPSSLLALASPLPTAQLLSACTVVMTAG